MKISQEANERNLKFIKDIQERWKDDPIPLKNIYEEAKKSYAHTADNNYYDRPTYKIGDGDYVQPVRPGSMDHAKHKSRGLLSSIPGVINNKGESTDGKL